MDANWKKHLEAASAVTRDSRALASIRGWPAKI